MTRHWLRLVAAASIGVATLTACSASMHATHEEHEDEGNEVKVNFADVPAPVQRALQQQAPGAKIDTVDKEMKDGKTVYEADARIDGKNWEIVVDETGKVVSKKLDEEDEKEEKGEKHEKH